MIKRLWLALAVSSALTIGAPADAQQGPASPDAKRQEAPQPSTPDVLPNQGDQARPKTEMDAAREVESPSGGGPAGCRYRPSKLELIV